MLKLVILLALFFSFTLNIFADGERKSIDVIPYDQADLTLKLEKFKSLVERNLVWRNKTALVIEGMNAQINIKAPFRAKNIRILSDYILPEYRQIGEQLKRLIQDMKWMLDQKTQIIFSRSESILYKTCGPQVIQTRCQLYNDHLKVELNPDDAKGTFYFLHGLNALASASLLVDNYLLVFSQLQSNAKLREIIRYEIPGMQRFLVDLNNEFYEISNYSNFNASADLFESFRAYYGLGFRQTLFDTVEFDFLYALIRNSYSIKEIMSEESLDTYQRASRTAKKDFFKDRIKHLRDERVYKLSKAFGNSAGSVKFRKGKLWNLAAAELASIQKTLQPLDMVFEKTPFILTDKLIPGHYGHLGIWIGTKADLVRLGIWEDPIVQKFHQEIQGGKGMVEALRPGVQINTLKHFMDIDDLAVVRLKIKPDLETTRNYIRTALNQIGKDYDFNFDVETPSRLICSEVIYVVYEDFDWYTDKKFGRYTISPENVGLKSLESGDFETILLYHDGKRYENELDKVFRTLLKEDYRNLPPASNRTPWI